MPRNRLCKRVCNQYYDVVQALTVGMDRIQKLAQDIAKASDALKNWGNSEGDDLGVRQCVIVPVRRLTLS